MNLEFYKQIKYFSNEAEVKRLLDQANLREFIARRPGLQEVYKEGLQVEG